MSSNAEFPLLEAGCVLAAYCAGRCKTFGPFFYDSIAQCSHLYDLIFQLINLTTIEVFPELQIRRWLMLIEIDSRYVVERWCEESKWQSVGQK
jgi:hypothetical protein